MAKFFVVCFCWLFWGLTPHKTWQNTEGGYICSYNWTIEALWLLYLLSTAPVYALPLIKRRTWGGKINKCRSRISTAWLESSVKSDLGVQFVTIGLYLTLSLSRSLKAVPYLLIFVIRESEILISVICDSLFFLFVNCDKRCVEFRAFQHKPYPICFLL